jgi:hypothetical protein
LGYLLSPSEEILGIQKEIKKIYNSGSIYYRMNSDNIYKYLGLAVIAIYLLYIVIKSMKFQANIIEGMASASASSSSSSSSGKTSTDNLASAVKSNTDTIEDALTITKYRRPYEDTLINLETSAGVSMLSTITKNAEIISKDPTSVESQKVITIVNNLKAFKDSLNDTMSTLDKL